MISRRIRELYDRSAHQYATRNAGMREGLVETGARFLKLAGEQPYVLDLGCGAGRDMAWLEQHGARMAGADLSAGMLTEARGIVHGPLVQADMGQLPFADASFNGVWCMASMLHLPKANAPLALAEIERVLLPAGVLLLGLQIGKGEVWEANPYGVGERFFARYSEEEATEMLARSGFTTVYSFNAGTPHRQWLHLIATSDGKDGFRTPPEKATKRAAPRNPIDNRESCLPIHLRTHLSA